MFGTIGHAKLKPGGRAALDSLMDEWNRDIRPRIPGRFVSYVGNKAGNPDEIVVLALAQDKATYRHLADLPEQDTWYHRFAEHVEGEVTWEDVEMDES